MKKIIEVKNLTKEYKKLKAIDNLSFDVYKGEILGLLGPNGSGKSTLMKLLLEDMKEVEYQGNIELIEGLSISYLPQIFTEYTGSLKEFSEKQKISYEDLLNTLKKMGTSLNQKR